MMLSASFGKYWLFVVSCYCCCSSLVVSLLPPTSHSAVGFTAVVTALFVPPHRDRSRFSSSSSLVSRTIMSVVHHQDQDQKEEKDNDEIISSSKLPELSFRLAQPEDIAQCLVIESASYPSDEAATLESLTYRQAYATEYFLLVEAVINSEDNDNNKKKTIIGFCCATRCAEFTEESMSTQHDPTGPLLAIHSVVIDQPYRRQGIATLLLQTYIQQIQDYNLKLAATILQPSVVVAASSKEGEEEGNEEGVTASPPPPAMAIIESIVLLSKSHLLGFYVNGGFSVIRPSPIVHGKELWYDLEQKLIRTLPSTTTTADSNGTDEESSSWFVKTEQFSKPFPQIQPYLKEHTNWVQALRAKGVCITSGYRVDEYGKPGGGGLMILAAKSYDHAKEIILQDPLVANDCVEWELNGWKSQVGDVQLR